MDLLPFQNVRSHYVLYGLLCSFVLPNCQIINIYNYIFCLHCISCRITPAVSYRPSSRQDLELMISQDETAHEGSCYVFEDGNKENAVLGSLVSRLMHILCRGTCMVEV